jgi:hypothetical protein
MPGLLRGVARTAVVAGTASAVNGRVQRRQAEKFADRDAQIAAGRTAYPHVVAASAPPPAPSAPAAEPDTVDQLERLGALRSQGLLTDEEFAAQKVRILRL